MSRNSGSFVTRSYAISVILSPLLLSTKLVWVRQLQTKLIRQRVGLEAAASLFSEYVALICSYLTTGHIQLAYPAGYITVPLQGLLERAASQHA